MIKYFLYGALALFCITFIVSTIVQFVKQRKAVAVQQQENDNKLIEKLDNDEGDAGE